MPTLPHACASGVPGGGASRGSLSMQKVWQSSPLWHDAASAIGTITVTASIAGSVSLRTMGRAYQSAPCDHRTMGGTPRAGLVVACLVAVGCTAEVTMDADLRHANGRAPYRTVPDQIVLLEHDVGAPYDVLADLQVTVRQRSAFGDPPRRDDVARALREHAARIGAHAVVMIGYGTTGMGFWTYKELQAHGRAIRFR